MKSSLLLLAVATGAAIAADLPMTDAVSPQQMLERQRGSSLAKEQVTPGAEAKVERPGEQSLIKQSDILHDGSNWTIVPKGAVLHVPAQMSPRVGAKPLGTLLSWTDFLTANRGWILTEEVSFEQAAGKKPLPEKRKEFWVTQTKVIVAVHRGGPISVRPAPVNAPAVTQK